MARYQGRSRLHGYKELSYEPPSKVLHTRQYYLWTGVPSHSLHSSVLLCRAYREQRRNTLYRQPSDSGYPSVPDLRVGLIGTDVAFLPLGRHTLLLFTLHRKEIIQAVGVPENHIAGLNGQRSLKEKHKGPKNLSKTRQDMRVYSPNPPISEVEGGSVISLDWLSVIHLVREKRGSRINSSGALCKETQRLMQDHFNKTRTVPCHRHVTAASWTAPYQVLPCHRASGVYTYENCKPPTSRSYLIGVARQSGGSVQ